MKSRVAPIALAACLFASAGQVALGAEGHDHAAVSEQAGTVKPEGPSRSELSVQLPEVSVIRQDGKPVKFKEAVDDGRPVMLNFIFTSCPGICPVLSQIFTRIQGKLGAEAGKLHLASVSIDPENDTPEKLREYAKKFKAGPAWDHYTGTQQASIAIQKAFKAYRGDKMNHAPVIFFRAAPEKPWIRLEGFVSPELLIGEYDKALGKPR
jgi:protein SCO1